MGLFDRFRKPKTDKASQKEAIRVKKKKDQDKLRKQREEETKKRQFQAVGSAGAPAPKKVKEPKEKAVKPEEKKKTAKTETGIAPRVIVRPIITEKATELGVYNKYAFEVEPLINKIEIKKAIHDLYGVEAIKVSIINNRGRGVRYGRSTGSTKHWKKAIITLKQGDKIDINT